MTLWNPPKRFPLSGSDGGACATGVAGHLVASSGHKTLLGWADPELVALKVPVEIQIIPLQLSVELLPFLNCSIASPRESLWKITWFLTVSTTQGEYQPWGCLLRLWASLHFFPGPPGWGGLVLFSVPIQKKDQFTGLFKATLALLKWTSFWRQKEEENGSRVMSVSRSPRSASFQGASQHLPKLTRGLWGPRPELRSSRRHSLGASWSKSASQFWAFFPQAACEEDEEKPSQ